jgi:hypothetical protein
VGYFFEASAVLVFEGSGDDFDLPELPDSPELLDLPELPDSLELLDSLALADSPLASWFAAFLSAFWFGSDLPARA